jgi:hypothetical protein
MNIWAGGSEINIATSGDFTLILPCFYNPAIYKIYCFIKDTRLFCVVLSVKQQQQLLPD